MLRKMIVFSDLSEQMVPEGNEATITIKSHPAISDAVQLDVAAAEIKSILQAAGEYVLLEITVDGATKDIAMELADFNALFKTDAYAVLANARTVKAKNTTAKTNKTELAKIREWATSQGIEVNTKGRIRQETVDAYHAAQAA